MVRAVHYLNQFFAGIGGEEEAETPPTRFDGAIGPGRGLAAALEDIEIVATVACGDDYFAEHEDDALAELLELIRAEEPAVVIAGPAFGSGRYGYACARVVRAAAAEGISALAAMHEENPGVAAAGRAVIVPTAVNVAGMRDALPRIAALAGRLAAGEELGPPDAEGYMARGLRRNVHHDKPGAERAIDLLLDKLAGETRTEISGGRDSVPQGNPDHLPSVRAGAWLRYSLLGESRLEAGRYECVHGGFDVALANEDPNRLVPLDTVSSLVEEGRIGRLHDRFYTTTGNGTPVARATEFGREIAAELKEAGVEAVLLSGT